jgi:hypothetical protein
MRNGPRAADVPPATPLFSEYSEKRAAKPWIAAAARGHRCRYSTLIPASSMAKLFAVSIVILTGSPAFAARTVHHNAHCLSCEQKAPKRNALRWTGGDTRHDDWPAGMILG